MGVSTDAILAFGFDLGEELPGAWVTEDEDDLDEILALDMGIKRPEVKYSKESEAIYCDYWDKQREAVKQSPVEVITHCSCDYPMYFLAVNGTQRNASRGSPESLDLADLVVTQEQIEAIRLFCDRHNIEWQQPKWHLFSMWC